MFDQLAVALSNIDEDLVLDTKNTESGVAALVATSQQQGTPLSYLPRTVAVCPGCPASGQDIGSWREPLEYRLSHSNQEGRMTAVISQAVRKPPPVPVIGIQDPRINRSLN